MKQGWKPKRTIIYCAWDGEEPGLLGSTEWVEEHDAELKQHAVVYINSDSSSRGYLYASGSHTLERVVNDVAKEIHGSREEHVGVEACADCAASRALLRRKSARSCATAPTCASARWATAPITRRSSITPGVAALNIGFGGEAGGGVYHSIYDDFYWYTHFGDPNFLYEKALAQMGGHDRDAHGRCRSAALRSLGFGRHREALRWRAEDRAEEEAGRSDASAIGRSKKACSRQPPIPRSSMCRHR